jgi:hypothetical protein
VDFSNFATERIKKHYIDVTVSVSKGEPTVKFTRRIKNDSMFVWPQTDDICEIETEDQCSDSLLLRRRALIQPDTGHLLLFSA